MDELIGGTEALAMLGVNKKTGKAADLLRKRFGIEPVFSKRNGRGTLLVVKREDVANALVKEERKRAERNANQEAQITNLIRSGERTKFVPTVEALEILRRIESKMDKMLMMWGDKSDS